MRKIFPNFFNSVTVTITVPPGWRFYQSVKAYNPGSGALSQINPLFQGGLSFCSLENCIFFKEANTLYIIHSLSANISNPEPTIQYNHVDQLLRKWKIPNRWKWMENLIQIHIFIKRFFVCVWQNMQIWANNFFSHTRKVAIKVFFF